jgi:hypothetical protein
VTLAAGCPQVAAAVGLVQGDRASLVLMVFDAEFVVSASCRASWRHSPEIEHKESSSTWRSRINHGPPAERAWSLLHAGALPPLDLFGERFNSSFDVGRCCLSSTISVRRSPWSGASSKAVPASGGFGMWISRTRPIPRSTRLSPGSRDGRAVCPLFDDPLADYAAAQMMRRSQPRRFCVRSRHADPRDCSSSMTVRTSFGHCLC